MCRQKPILKSRNIQERLSRSKKTNRGRGSSYLVRREVDDSGLSGSFKSWFLIRYQCLSQLTASMKGQSFSVH